MVKEDTRKWWYILGTVIALTIITFLVTYSIYGNKLESISSPSGLEIAYSNRITEGTSQVTSTTIGKSVEEVANIIEENTTKVAVNTSVVEEQENTVEETAVPEVVEDI